MYFQFTSNLACGRVWTGADGYSWVCMGALGRVGTGEHKNQTSIDTMGPGRVRIWMHASGKFPKIHACGHRHEMGIIRDSGGRGWVGWVQGGVSIHSKRKTRPKDSLGASMTWFRQACRGGELLLNSEIAQNKDQRQCGGKYDMISASMQGGGRFINNKCRKKRAQNYGTPPKKQINRLLKKYPKTKKAGNSITIVKKRRGKR